jgi:DNA-directed RNA polymerase beta' subunit
MSNTIFTNSVFDCIEFGVLSVEDILHMSVAEINNTKLQGANSVYDERLGPTVITKDNCKTCGLASKSCTGHFGHIKLAHPILHPLYEKEIIKLLKLFCFSCSRLIQTDERAVESTNKPNFKKLDRAVDKFCICPFCNLKQPIWEVEDSESISSLYMNFGETKVECTSIDILSIFEKLILEDLEKLNFFTCPVNLIIQLLPVLPPSTRPVVMLDSKFCDDDLTIQYIEIIKINNLIQTKKEATTSESIDKYIKVLYFRISSLFNNSSGKSKHNTNGKAIKGIKERLATKNGLMRENLMGKRVEQSARTVIGPEPTLCMNEIVIPEEFAKTLTISERVTQFNIERLTQLVHFGQAKFIHRVKGDSKLEINLQYALKKRGTRIMNGDIIIRKGKEIRYDHRAYLQVNDYLIRDGELINVVMDGTKEVKLEIGDVVDRCLRNGDYVVLNRQPTLHSGSMIAQRVRILPGKTLRFSLCITKSLNADFDGDEGNLHVAQKPNTIIEMEELSSVKNHILSQQSGNTNTVLVQDNLLSLYLMTFENTPIEKEEFFDICMCLVDIKGQPIEFSELNRKFKHLGLEIAFETQTIPSVYVISLCFPDTFSYKNENCEIYNGKWISGCFTKKVMSQVIKQVYHVYGDQETMKMINNLTFVSNQWLYARGFSIGLEDCLTNSEQSLIPETILRCFTEANSLQSQIYHEGIKEIRIQGSLNKARDVGMRIAKEGLSANNNFLSTVHSGSKGDFFNIAQIAGLLGQQNFRGRRVERTLNHGKRSLYHYNWDLKEDKDIYESRGFIRHSFLRGLNPREQFFHAVSGREGITDTALGTGETGYMQRRIIKLMEDIHIANDGTLRDDCNQIYEFYYGKYGLDTVGNVQLTDLANEMNARYELDTRIN